MGEDGGALGDFGEKLGIAFQITDDLIDYIEAKETTGKPSGSDLRERKVTLPLIHTLGRATPAARREIVRLFEAAEPADADVLRVIDIVADSGGLEYARSCGERYAARAREALDSLPANMARTGLEASITYVMERHS